MTGKERQLMVLLMRERLNTSQIAGHGADPEFIAGFGACRHQVCLWLEAMLADSNALYNDYRQECKELIKQAGIEGVDIPEMNAEE